MAKVKRDHTFLWEDIILVALMTLSAVMGLCLLAAAVAVIWSGGR